MWWGDDDLEGILVFAGCVLFGLGFLLGAVLL